MKIMLTTFFYLLVLTPLKFHGYYKEDTQNSRLDSTFIEINLAHLDHLNEEIDIDGIPMIITHIYSEYPDYNWVDASEEGIACVDDVSRAAMVYLKYFTISGDSAYLDKAKNCLNFVMYMEEDDGQFYNFIRDDYSKNIEGRTSKKSFNFWAARGLRSLCYGYRVIKPIDEQYAERLREHIERTFNQIEEFLKDYGKYEIIEGIKIPKWLVIGGDITSEVVLALLDYYLVIPDSETKVIIEKLVHGLIESQIRDPTSPFYGMHLSWKNIWHLWGNTQTEVLAKAGRIFNNPYWIESAKIEADNFYLYLLSKNFLESIRISQVDKPEIGEFPQIAYGIRPMVSGFIQLYISTGDDKYAKLAGLAASWLRGNNRAKQPVYDPKTGRIYDGIDNEIKINLNSGAESTIEGIMTLLEISNIQMSVEFFNYDLEVVDDSEGYVLYGNATGKKIKIEFDEEFGRWEICEI